jgi:hypothetical protein
MLLLTVAVACRDVAGRELDNINAETDARHQTPSCSVEEADHEPGLPIYASEDRMHVGRAHHR